ncbi:MAG: hypothetical protein IJH86_07935 [Clostridia bacterium]|nr:hypothetical protein [Clostridia bacterium]
MIRGIRRRFIRIALGVLALAMVLVTGIINVANWVNVRAELYETMEALSQGQGQGGQFGRKGGRNRHMRNMLDESLYFTVLLDGDGTPAFRDRSRMADADEAEIDAIVAEALGTGRESGFCRDHLFCVCELRGSRAMIFLNCETKLTRVRRLALISAAACVGCILLAWVLVALFSRRAIKPLVENAVMQKQFITDAGHELKTPLTVIAANMDVLALETGENEWVRSTRKQVANMRGLVNELIYLSRLDEEDARLGREDIDLSKLVREAAEPFVGMAEFSGKSMDVAVEDGIRVTGDAAALNRLVSILCDNAVKYAPEGDTIAVALKRDRRGVALTAENGLAAPLSPEALSHLFDRFYRVDASRSKTSGGYGIGLSVARAIVEKHGGRIAAKQSGDGQRIKFICRL